MNNTFAQPLEIKHDHIDPATLNVIRRIDGITRACKAEYFLAGATAREIMLRNVFGRAPGRRTLDVDFGIAVEAWEHFESLKNALQQHGGFEPDTRHKQRLIDTEGLIVVDLIPFGGVEHGDTIAWPPDQDVIMRVTGFRDALASAVLVRLAPDLVISVISLPMLLALKLFAWSERKAENRDAQDIYTLLKQYGDAGNEDRLYGEHFDLLEAEGFDFEPAGAKLLGMDAANSVAPDTRQQLANLLDSEKLMRQLLNQMIASTTVLDRDTTATCELLLRRFTEGFLSG